jgi:uncharacterized RDD family membrane protein YckC
MASGPWFYVDGGQQRGPVGTEDLASWILSARLPRDVHVWREGLAQWMPAETLPEIASHLQVVGFFLMGAGGPQGPIEPRILMEWARAGHIGRETLLWRTGLPDWITAGALPELAPYLPAAAPAAYAPAPGMYVPAPSAPAPAPAAIAPGPAAGYAPSAREARPATDRDGPCPLCGDARKMGKKARKLYDVWVCRRCGNGQINRRHFAYVLDLLLLYGGMVFVLAFFAGAVGGVGHADVREIVAVIPYVAWGLFLFKDGFNGHSLGKAMMGLQVVDQDSGEGAGFGASFKRNLPLLIPLVPLIVAFQLGSGPRTGDGWANTRVVWKKQRGRGPF